MDKFCKNCKEDIKEDDFYISDIEGNFIHITCLKAYTEHEKTIADKVYNDLTSMGSCRNGV